jgi:hypothetical protein
MVFLCRVVFGFITKPPTMIRLFAELSGRYRNNAVPAIGMAGPDRPWKRTLPRVFYEAMKSWFTKFLG